MNSWFLLPFIIPSYIITLSWSSFFSSRGAFNGFLTSIELPGVDIYTMGGIILVLGFCNIPIVYVNVVHMLRKIPRGYGMGSQSLRLFPETGYTEN